MNDQFGNTQQLNNSSNNPNNNDNNKNLLLGTSFNLLTNIISFLDCIHRCRLMRSSLYIYNACHSNISKYHCLINSLMLKHTFHISQFYPTNHLTIKNSNTVYGVDASKFADLIFQIIKNSPKLHTIELKRCGLYAEQVIEEKIPAAFAVSGASIKNLIVDGYGLEWDDVNRLCCNNINDIKCFKNNTFVWSSYVISSHSDFRNIKILSLYFNNFLVLTNSIFLLSQFKQLKELELYLYINTERLDNIDNNNANVNVDHNNDYSEKVNQAFSTLENRLKDKG